jgi:putative ubiquitin-RnfH superfamily antitoxin RatB of RatAB toxin-antitoxin module
VADPAQKECLVAVDGPQGPLLVPVLLPADAPVAAALAQARGQLLRAHIDAAVDWGGAAAGIFGVRCGREAVPRAGDRIELYRPLLADPRHSRRQRAGRARRGRAGRA